MTVSPPASRIADQGTGQGCYGRDRPARSAIVGLSAHPGKGAALMSSETEIRPFRVEFPDEAIADLRRRIAATRWPERETVADDSQGVRLAMMQELAGYWGTDYDWRKCEAKLNTLPQFITEIDGLDLHFIHVRSP